MGADDTTETNEVSHAVLATAALRDDVGIWDGDQEITPRPGAPSQHHTSVSTRTLLADRWLVVDLVVDSGFVGHGVYGWDSYAQCYTGIWIDSMMQSIARVAGTYEVETSAMKYTVEVVHNGRTLRYREIVQRPDEDTRLYTQLVPLADGGEHEMIRITYRRRRPAT